MARLLSGLITALLMGLLLATGPAQAHCEQQGGSHSGATGSQEFR